MSVDEKYLQSLMRTLSHDMGSAVRAASGFSTLLAKKYAECLDDKALNWLSLICSEGEKAQVQLKALSRYAMLYGVDGVDEQCDLTSLCGQAQASEEVEQALLEHPDMTITLSSLPVIRGNAQAWLQYFIEMLLNSIQHTPTGEVISCDVFSEPCSNGVIIVVQDNGLGLSPAAITKAMKPYRSQHFSADGNTVLGLGMGMSIAKRVVELHEGKFHIGARRDKISGLRVEALLPLP